LIKTEMRRQRKVLFRSSPEIAEIFRPRSARKEQPCARRFHRNGLGNIHFVQALVLAVVNACIDYMRKLLMLKKRDSDRTLWSFGLLAAPGSLELREV